jgi:tellurite resistance protein
VDSLDVEGLVGSVLRGVLGGRRKRSRGALRYLTNGRSSLLNASTLLTVAGVAWGLWETASKSSATPATSPSGSSSGGATPAPTPAGDATPGAGGAKAPPPQVVPPPLPPNAAVGGPPPLPSSAAPGIATGLANVPPEVVRVLRLTLSAARADGTLAPHEREAILAQARAVGAEALVASELDSPRPLSEIVTGATEARARQDLYTLAFTIVRADEQVSDVERAYLLELAQHLQLEPDIVAELERDAARRIGAEAEGAQH